MNAERGRIYSQLSLIIILLSFFLEISECTNGPNKNSGNPIVSRPGITTRSSAEGLGRTYDKGVKDTLSLLEQYYDGTDDWRRYNVVNKNMKNAKDEISSEYNDNLDNIPNDELMVPTESEKVSEISAVAQTPADYKLPDAVIPLTKYKVNPLQNNKLNLKDSIDEDPTLGKGELSEDASEDQTEVLSVLEGQSEGTEYEYKGDSEGFGPSDMGYEVLSDHYDPNMESYSYQYVGDDSEGGNDYSYKLESEAENTDPGMSYMIMDENGDNNGLSYIYRDGSENSNEYPGTEYDYVEDNEKEDSVRYISENGNDSDFEERYINEAGSDGSPGTETVYIDDADPEGTEYEYTGNDSDRTEVSEGEESENEDSKRNGKRRSRRHPKKPKLPKKWETFTEDEKQEWLDRHPRTKQILDDEYGENRLSGRRPRRSRKKEGFEPLDKKSTLMNRRRRHRPREQFDEYEDPILNGRGRRGRKPRGEDVLDNDLGLSRSGPRRRRRRDIHELNDSPRMRNRRRRRGYDLIQDIKGDPYLTTIGERVLLKYPVDKRDKILKLRENALRNIKKGRRPTGDFEDIIDPVDLMLIYRDANKMPLLTVKNEGDIPLEYMLKLPKGLYRWEEIEPQERAKLRRKWKEEIERGTFWDDDKLHGDWSDEVRLLGEWGEEEAIRGILGRETSPENQMGEEYSYYSFVPKFTDLRNKGVFSGEYPEDIEHLVLVGDMLPEDSFHGDFRVPETQLLKFHPRFSHYDEIDDFVLENIQSRRNEGLNYSPRHKPSWMEYRTGGTFGKGISADKYSWLESLDRDNALKIIEEANYGDPDFNEKLLIKYPWLRDRIGEAVYFDDGLILPIQVLNEFIPSSVYNLAKEDEKYPGSKWYFSEIPSDKNLDKFITDIYERMGPNSRYKSYKLNPYLNAGLENLFEMGLIPDGWDRETVNYLRELFRDAENREIELLEELNGHKGNGSMYPGSSRRRKHRLRFSKPDMPIWYFGTEEQRDRERRLEFAIESDSTGEIIEGKPSVKKVFLDPTGRNPGGILSLELQDISDDAGYDVESLEIPENYFDDDDDDDLNLEMLGSYPSSRASPLITKNIYFDSIPEGKYSDINTGIYPANYNWRLNKNRRRKNPNFNPIRRYIFNDDDIDIESPLSISQSDFLQESSGFNERNPYLIGKILGMNKDHLNRYGRPDKTRKNGRVDIYKRYPKSHKVNEFGQEDPMEIISDYYDLNENSILDVLDGKGIYRPKKKKVGYGVSDLDYLRRSNEDDWNYMKKLKESNSSKPRFKRNDKPLWYYYDTIGRRWDDSIQDDVIDSSIDLVVKELQSKRRDNKKFSNKGRTKYKGGKSLSGKEKPKYQSEYDVEDYSIIEIEKDMKGKGKNKSKRRGSKKQKGKGKSKKGRDKKDKRVTFKLIPGEDEIETSESSSESSSMDASSSQDESSNLYGESEMLETSKSGSDEDDEDFEELGPLAKRILMAAGYDDDLDPSVPLSIETEILDLVDTGKKGIRMKNKQKRSNKFDKGDSDGLLSLEKMREANKKIKIDKHDLSEIRRMRRDLNDDSGDFEALKALIKKLHLNDFIDLNDDYSSDISQDLEKTNELEKSDNESETSVSEDIQKNSEDSYPLESNSGKSNLKPLKVVRIKKNKDNSINKINNNGDSEEVSVSNENNAMDTSQVEEEEISLSEWDDFINEEIKNLESKPIKSKSGEKKRNEKNRKNSRRKKGLTKSKEEKEALLSLGIDPKVVKRMNFLLKDKENGVKNALDYLLDELENNIDDSPESRTEGKRSKRRKRKNRKRRQRENAARRPYDLEPVTPAFSRYILKLKDVLGPKEALDELLDNLDIDLSGQEPVQKELRRYITPNVVNEIRVLRDKKNGDEKALNKLLNVLKIPNKRLSRTERSKHSKHPSQRVGRRLPALLNDEDIKTVNRLLKRNKAPQALEYFLKSTDLDKDLEDNNKRVYRPNRSYSGLDLSPEKLSKITYLMNQGPQGCRDALSEIYDDLGIPKQKNLFDGSWESFDKTDPRSRKLLKRNRQRKVIMPPYLGNNQLDYSDSEDIIDDEFSEFDDFSTFIPRDYYQLNSARRGNIIDPVKMLPFRKDSVIPDAYRSLQGSSYPNPIEDQYSKTLINSPILRNSMIPTPRYYKAPEMSQYNRDLRDFVNNRRKAFGMPNIPDYQYWNYEPEITGRSVYEGLDTPTNRRRRQILDRKRKLGNYLDEEHEVSVLLDDDEDNGMGKENSSKTVIMKSFVDDDLPESSEEFMLVQKPEYSEEELYDMGQCAANDIVSNKIKAMDGKETNGNSNIELEGLQDNVDGFEVEREATREEIISTLITDPRMEISKKLILKEVSDDDDSVINKLSNMAIENPMMDRSNIPKPLESVEKLKDMQNQAPKSKEITSFGYLDPSLSSYDKKLYSDNFVQNLENENFEASPVSISSQMFEECKDITNQLKMKELGCEKISGDTSESRKRPLDVRRFSKRVSKVKNIYVKSFLKQISFPGEVAKLYIDKFSDLKGWNKAMDKHRWVALPLVSPQSYIPNLGGLNLFQRMVLHQAVKKQKSHSPRRVVILAFSTRPFSEKKLPNSFASLGDFSSKKNSISSVEYSMNVEYNQGMLVIPLIDLALCVKGALQLNNTTTSKSKRTKLGTCIVGGVRSHFAAQKIYRVALKYLEMSPDLSMAKFLIIPVRVGKENLSEQLRLSESGNVDKNFDLQIPEDAISPAVSDLEFSKLQFEMKFENSKQVKERYNNKLSNLSETIFKLYLMNSRELDIRSLKANGPRSVVIPMSFPQLYIKGYSRAQKLVKKIQNKYKPSLKNRSYRNKLKPGFILLINDSTVNSGLNIKSFLNEQIKRIQSFFTNPYSFKNFKSRKHEGPVLEIKGVNSLQTRKFLLDAIARASRQPSVVPMIILPIFVDNNLKTSKSDRRAMNKALKKNIKHSNNI